MPSARTWTAAEDATLRAMRAEGRSLDDIAAAVGLHRWTVRDRCGLIGAVPPKPVAAEEQPTRTGPEPLPAGHPVSWGPISQGREWPSQA